MPFVLMHDGVRCLVTDKFIYRCLGQALAKFTAIPAVAATDGIRIVNNEARWFADRNNIRYHSNATNL
jgi:2-C-methyl-D-erythritol 4-phosphate cytidylyltransferase